MFLHFEPHFLKEHQARVTPSKIRFTMFLPLNTIVTLNQYINLERQSRFAAAATKKRLEHQLALEINAVKPSPLTEGPYHIHFTWAVQNKRSDLDNVVWAKKYVLDALVRNGVLPGDGMRHICSFSDDYIVSTHKGQGVHIEIYEPLTINEQINGSQKKATRTRRTRTNARDTAPAVKREKSYDSELAVRRQGG